MADSTIQVKTLKLTSGEELVSQVLNLTDPDRWYMLEYPLRVEHWYDDQGQDRYDLIPYLFSSDDFYLKLRTGAVACIAQPNNLMLRRYRKVVGAISNSAEAMESLQRRGNSGK